MKKLLLISSFCSSVLLADAGIYIGTGYAYNSETLSTTNKTISNNAARIKIGYGDIKAYAIELSFDYIDNNKFYFAQNDGEKYGFNIELLKAFDFGIFFNPFLKAGFGGGYMKTAADLHNQKLSYGSFNFGVGAFIPLSKHFDLEIAYEYKNLSYEKLDITSSLTNPKSDLNIAYCGFNYRF